MLFCDQALAARIERAECQMLADAAANVARRLPDVYAVPASGGLALLTEPGSPLNKVAGLGFAPFDELGWTAVEAEHARRNAPIQVELSTLADPAIARFLTARGYELVGVENVLGRAPGAVASVPVPGLRIEACAASELALLVEVSVAGFLAADTQGVPSHEPIEAYDRAAVTRTIEDFVGAAGVTMFLARIDGEPAGAATMRIGDGIASLAGASTLPPFRRRGVQSALLAHRLAHAARACDLVVVTTLPGSKSQQNMHRAGFELLYGRNVLRRRADARGRA